MRLLWLAAILLSACGYHLVGHGDGAGVIPADVHHLSVIANTEAEALLPKLRERLRSDQLTVSIDAQDIGEGSDRARLMVMVLPVKFTPSAYDAAGVESQYRMIYAGSMSLEYQGESIWQSGILSEQGDVYVTGDPTSIEASRQQLLRGLRKQWLQTAVARLRSGF